MKFAFCHQGHGHHRGVGGVIVPTSHPPALVVIDAHRVNQGMAELRGEYSVRSSPASRHFENLDMSHFEEHESPRSPAGGGAPLSKRALHLERHESECPVSNPDPALSPGSRQFFRLGRYRAKGVDRAYSNKASCAGSMSSDSSDDEPGLGERSKRARRKGIAGLRRPTLRRAQSLTELAGWGAVAAAPGGSPTQRLGITSDAANGQARPVVGGRGRHVSFSRVTIREYSTILGDHPCCPSGPPLSLGWTLEREDSLGLEDYERGRGPPSPAIKLSGKARRNILSGLSMPAAFSHNSSSEDERETVEGRAVSIYSRAELRRAERRLARERVGCNARLHRKTNDRFFSRPLSPVVGAAPVVGAGVKLLEGELDVAAVKPWPKEEGKEGQALSN